MEHWWKNTDPIYKESGDGQRFIEHYARNHRGRWEYASVTYSDDGEFISAILFKSGNATYVESQDETEE
jgi:hypothetical protein